MLTHYPDWLSQISNFVPLKKENRTKNRAMGIFETLKKGKINGCLL